MCHRVAGFPSKACAAAPFSAALSWLSAWTRDQADRSSGADEEGSAAASGTAVPVAETLNAPAVAGVLTRRTPERSAGSKYQPDAAVS